MNKAAVVFLALFPVAAVAAMPEKPVGWVTDQANVITPSDRVQIESLATDLKTKTSAELAVVTIVSLEGDSIDAVATRLFQRWGIGENEKNNGVLFLVAPSDRKLRIEVGYGLEGVLNDAKVGRIADERVLPYFRDDRLSEGILSGARTIAAEIEGTDENKLPIHRGVSFDNLVFILFIVLFLIILVRPRRRGFWYGGWGGGGFGGGGFGGGGFGGFGGGSSGGGGASRGW